ncbi:MAG TPA: hypothetical protein VKA18_00880 [Alphaproteobacteria bacterium]|nr:hypothetical protein [Alphaproteobacteria bacterium]
MTSTRLIGNSVAAICLMAAAGASAAASEKQKALQQGARALAANEIAEVFVGNTGTWVSASGDKTVRIHYGRENKLSGELVGGDWSGAGFYGVANDDSICISWNGIDDGRLRCFDVLVQDGVVKKYNPDGSLNGTYKGFGEGNTL